MTGAALRFACGVICEVESPCAVLPIAGMPGPLVTAATDGTCCEPGIGVCGRCDDGIGVDIDASPTEAALGLVCGVADDGNTIVC